MTKFLLFLVLLINVCKLENLDNVKVFEISEEEYNGDEIKIRKGESFALKFYSNPSTGYSLYYLNKDEVNDSLLFIKSEYVADKTPVQLRGRGGHLYYYFKGIEETDEAKTLKFTYSRGKKENGIVNYSVKISVY